MIATSIATGQMHITHHPPTHPFRSSNRHILADYRRVLTARDERDDGRRKEGVGQ